MPLIQLTPAQRKVHRADAHHLDPVVMVGNDGLTANVKKEADGALNAHGLIKVRVFSDDRVAREAMFQTLADDELLDPTITPEILLFRLFHEDGVRLEDARALVAQCRCSRDRIASVLTSFDPAERADMVEADGKIRVTCEYCATVYDLEPEEVVAG